MGVTYYSLEKMVTIIFHYKVNILLRHKHKIFCKREEKGRIKREQSELGYGYDSSKYIVKWK